MASTFINTAAADSASTSSLVCNKPTNTADNDIMFALVISLDRLPNSVPSGWSTLASKTNGDKNYVVYYKIASSEGASYTWGFASSSRTAVQIATYRGGFKITDPIDTFSNTTYTTSDTTCRAASITTASVNETLLFIGAVFSTSAESFTKPSVPTTGWVEDVDFGATSSDFYRTICSMEWASSGATGDINSTMTISTSEKHAFAIALKPEGYSMTMDLGTYTLSGQNVGLNYIRNLVMSAGSYVLTGQNLVLNYIRTLLMEVGTYIFTGNPVILRLKAWINQTKNTSTWTSSSKNSSNWTNQNKS